MKPAYVAIGVLVAVGVGVLVTKRSRAATPTGGDSAGGVGDGFGELPDGIVGSRRFGRDYLDVEGESGAGGTLHSVFSRARGEAPVLLFTYVRLPNGERSLTAQVDRSAPVEQALEDFGFR